MSEWYEVPYKGGPMAVPSAHFPRPLYPPDAAAKGKQPSEDGPDVLAYKRTICRLGRWGEWDPASWDDSFSNPFSHGRGPNVADSGVAGFQRQMNVIPDTGWIGQATFNMLASARVPEGRANAGQAAMDANACNLIAEAFQKYGGKPPPPVSTKPQREEALEGAIRWLGYKESPPGSNHTKFGAWYGMDYQPWCAMFVTYCYEVEAGGSKHFAQGASYSYVPYMVNNAKAGIGGFKVASSPIPGDLVTYDWARDGVPDHIGFFEDGNSSSFTAIEGNTSTSDNSNGGEVMRRHRKATDAAIVFIRVAE